MSADDATPAPWLDAPRLLRRLLVQAKSGDVDAAETLRALRSSLSLLLEAQRPCSATEKSACEALAADAIAVGGWQAGVGVGRVATRAQAAQFQLRWRAWLRAREGRAHQPAPTFALPSTPPSWAELCGRPAYWRYDASRYDFRGAVTRAFASLLAELPDDGDGGSALARLHRTSAGARERGYAREWAADVDAAAPPFAYTKEADEATRYGCSSFHRAFKDNASARAELLAVYGRFIAEVVAPALGDARLVYQAEPILRFFLPHHLAVGPRHADAAYHEQPNELNVWVPLTDACESNSLMVESAAGAGDFAPVTCGAGDVYVFHGNSCEHYTELNVSDATRVSLDFRVIRTSELHLAPVRGCDDGEDAPATGVKGSAAYFSVGRYYSRLGR